MKGRNKAASMKFTILKIAKDIYIEDNSKPKNTNSSWITFKKKLFELYSQMSQFWSVLILLLVRLL